VAARRFVARMLAALVRADRRRRELAHLRELPDEILRDVGLTRADVWRADLPFFMQRRFR
jgi:uncharacterized protein YjiS (DUF1127 family)